MLTESLAGLRPFNHRLHITYPWLASMDAILFLAACYLAAWLYTLKEPLAFTGDMAMLPWVSILFSGITLLAMLSMGLYQPRLRESTHGILLRTGGAFVLMALAMTVVVSLSRDLAPWQGVLVYAAALSFASSLLTREVFRNTASLEQFNRRVLVLGAGCKAGIIANRMRRRSDYHGFRICAYVRMPGEASTVTSGNVITLQQPLSEYVHQNNVHQVVVAVDTPREQIPVDELMRCRTLGVPVVGIMDFFEQEAGKVLVAEASAEWFVFASGFKRCFAGGVCKSILDFGAGLCLLFVAWPVMLLTILAIKLEDGVRAPVIFRQKRVGLHGREFNVIKFRSMRIDAEGDGKARWATANDTRVTRVGQVIRKLRIDELPQIFNVLAGDMSFVGPRPERPEFVRELVKEIPFFEERHCVKPGITGWAQLHYPYGASVEDALHKLEFDLYYVKNQSFHLDLMVLLRTVEVVVFGKGAH